MPRAASAAASVFGILARRVTSAFTPSEAVGAGTGAQLGAGIAARSRRIAAGRPVRRARNSALPSGRITIASSARRVAVEGCASAAIGVRHVPSSAASNARSALAQSAVAASSIARQQVRARAHRRRAISMAMMPCPAAGSISSGAMQRGDASPRPSRFSPAARQHRRVAPRRRRASPGACRHCRAAARSRGRAARAAPAPCAAARRCRPGALRQRGDARRRRRVATSASRGSSRGRCAAITSPGGSQRRHVLQRMDGESIAAVEQRLLDLLGEQALAADLGERPVGDAVAGGADDDDFDRAGRGERGMRRRQPLAPPRGLGQRQLAAAGADAQSGRDAMRRRLLGPATRQGEAAAAGRQHDG